jgi:hypothetical protein
MVSVFLFLKVLVSSEHPPRSITAEETLIIYSIVHQSSYHSSVILTDVACAEGRRHNDSAHTAKRFSF